VATRDSITASELSALIEHYRVGLDAELVLLHRLEHVAARQRDTSHASALDALQLAADERDALMSGLMAIEQEIRPIRDRLTTLRAQARRLPGFAHVASLHEAAAKIVKDILETDRDSMRALTLIMEARRVAAQALEHGEATLAAYGRSAAAPPAATLVNRRDKKTRRRRMLGHCAVGCWSTAP